ncbi:SCO7613 C-terminal domain-containing membrane protein, partial [Microcella sp.]|uniref:SCO7613 C-terminal domain-containing membrane protein n=1 Tax=Microcella sp. TaxID=1913979 RepID=UPI00299F6DE5
LFSLALLISLAMDLPPVGSPRWLELSATLLGVGAVASRTARHALRGLFSGIAGVSVPLALVLAALALDPAPLGGDATFLVIVPLAAGVGTLTLTALTTAKRTVRRRSVLAGAMSVVVVSTVPAASLAALGALIALINAEQLAGGAITTATGVAAVVGLLVVSGVLVCQAILIDARAGRRTTASAASRAASLWMLGLAGIGALGLGEVNGVARASVAIVLVGAASVVITATPVGRRASASDRLPIVLAAHVALAMAVSLSWSSWSSTTLAVTLGSAVLVALAALAMAVPRALRPAHLAVGSAYALVLLAQALSLTGIEFAGLVSVTATVGLLVALSATVVGRVSTDYWMTLLVVAVVPALMAVALVISERTAWVVLSTSTMIALALSLVLTHRHALSTRVRSLAAAALVPSIAVVIVNLGAVLLESSGSPVVLPLIAVVVAVTLPLLAQLEAALPVRGLTPAASRSVVSALESTTWVTAAIAVMLSVAREAAGPVTLTVVLVVLALGAAAAAAVRRITRYWWLAGIIATAALWCWWFVQGVTSPEAHVLPPAVAAAAVALVLTARGRPHAGLWGAGLLGAIVPVLALIAIGADTSPARTSALLIAAVALTAAGAAMSTGRSGLRGRLSALRSATLAAAIIASMAGAIQGTRFGLGLDRVDAGPAVTLAPVALALALALAGAVPAAVAGVLLARDATVDQRRWALVPAITAVTVAGCSAIDADTLPVTWISAIGFALLITMVVAVWREKSVPTVLPRAWVLFGLALATAIVAWSPREILRVEAFSVSLGAMLLLAGAVAFVRGPGGASAPLHHWPMGRSGSWALLSPGIVVLVFASMLATATDPQTWRAVLVMAFALTAILVGVRWRLAAPFVLGMIVLPVENVLAFSVQIGRGIEAMPWWITLAVVGIVLLVIAVGSERRAGDGGTPTARLRDLR